MCVDNSPARILKFARVDDQRFLYLQPKRPVALGYLCPLRAPRVFLLPLPPLRLRGEKSSFRIVSPDRSERRPLTLELFYLFTALSIHRGGAETQRRGTRK